MEFRDIVWPLWNLGILCGVRGFHGVCGFSPSSFHTPILYQ